jgi:hypothetical protein
MERDGVLARVLIVGAALATVIVVDQAITRWGWRHARTARINYGGNPLVPALVDRWDARPVTGALLDLLAFGLSTLAVFLLVFRRRSLLVPRSSR